MAVPSGDAALTRSVPEPVAKIFSDFTAYCLRALRNEPGYMATAERAFGLLTKVYAKRAKIRGQQPPTPTADIFPWP
jgi:hypothetical protein